MEPLVQTVLGGVIAAIAGVLAQLLQGKYWVAQEKWRMKRQYYESLIRELNVLSDACSDCAVAQSVHFTGEPAFSERARARVFKSRTRLERHLTIAELWVPKDIFKEVRDFQWHLHIRAGGEDANWDSAAGAAVRARRVLVELARKDLNLTIPTTAR